MRVNRRISPEGLVEGLAEGLAEGSAEGGDGQASYLVGQDGEGHWLAVEIHGLGGGIFTSRDKAVQYARGESQRQPGAVRFADRPMHLFAS